MSGSGVAKFTSRGYNGANLWHNGGINMSNRIRLDVNPMMAEYVGPRGIARAELDGMKNITVCDAVVTIRSAANAAAEAQMDVLADELLAK